MNQIPEASFAYNGTAAELIQAARELFALHGYEGTSVWAITQRARTNLGAITYHFGSKRALYEAVLERGLRPMSELLESLQLPDWAPERLDALSDALLSQLEDEDNETRRLTKDGRILPVQLSSTIYHDRNGQPTGNIVTLRDISALKKTETVLHKYQNQLEDLVEERTAELAKINNQLAQEVEERKRAETALRKRESELEAQSSHLAEVNTALKVLLKQNIFCQFFLIVFPLF